MNELLPKSCFSDSQRRELAEKIYPLLGRYIKKYLAGNSTSVSIETAGELLESLLYTLRLVLSETGRAENELLACDLDELLLQGQRLLQKKVAFAKRLWEQACLTATQIKNRCYRDTLAEFGRFFRRYDPWYFAHAIPCSIDYPLCIPVSEKLQGVSYVEQWLRHLLTENRILSGFEQEAVIRLLTETAVDYWDYPLNLCEQPVLNAVGLALLEKPVKTLEISDETLKEIKAALCRGKVLGMELEKAADRAAAELRAPQTAAAYMRETVKAALPRLEAALLADNLRGFFLP